MKKIILLATVLVTITLNAQMYTGTVPDPRFNTNTFLDASENGVNFNNNTNKGLNFPQVNLTTFQLSETLADGIAYPTYYDGMIVYNTATGTTSGNTLTTQSSVTPGFYYFYNPNGTANGNITSGVWLPLGAASAKVNIKTTETVTNTLVNGAQVYAIKGQFTTTGSSTAVTITPPSGITAMYSITIYKAGTNIVYDRQLYSYNTTTGAAVTGSPSMSVVYPANTYDYVLEYLK